MPAAKTVAQFLLGQHAFTALRTLLGVVLPAGYALALFDNMGLGIGLALGAFCTSLVDIPEPLFRKPARMLAATLVLVLAGAAIALLIDAPLAAWLALLAIAFCAGLGVAYGGPGTLMGLCALLGADLTIAQHDANGALWPFLAWMGYGGLWYTAFSTAVCALLPRQVARRAVGESLMAAAAHLRRRADCFVPGIPLDQCQRRLVDAQSAAIDAQKVARDVVLGGMAGRRRHDAGQIHLFNMLTGAIDIHDISLALHGDFSALRGGGIGNHAARQLHDVIIEMAQWIEDLVPRYVTGRTVGRPFTANLDRRGIDTDSAQAFKARLAVLADTLTRLAGEADGSAHAGKPDGPATTGSAWDADIDLSVRTWQDAQKSPSPWQVLRDSSAAVRHAVRLAAAIAVGTLFAKWIGGHGTWVILTIMIVMSPTFGANQQRSRQRVAGTLLGCLTTAILLWCGVQAPWLLATSIIACYGVSFALARPGTYVASVFFGTIALLMLYHLLVPGWSMIEQRGVDTLIGGAIGALAAYVFPTWERQGLAGKLAAARRDCRRYAAAVFADDFDMSRYRVARRAALESVRTLTAAHQRMGQEPPAKRLLTAEIAMWLTASNMMIAALAALGQWRRATRGAPLPATYRHGAELVDRTLDGAPFTSLTGENGGPAQLPGDARKASSLPDLPPLIGAARSMQRANARLAAVPRSAAARPSRV